MFSDWCHDTDMAQQSSWCSLTQVVWIQVNEIWWLPLDTREKLLLRHVFTIHYSQLSRRMVWCCMSLIFHLSRGANLSMIQSSWITVWDRKWEILIGYIPTFYLVIMIYIQLRRTNITQQSFKIDISRPHFY